MFEQYATKTPVVSMIKQIKAKKILDGSVKEACSPDIHVQGALNRSISTLPISII